MMFFFCTSVGFHSIETNLPRSALTRYEGKNMHILGFHFLRPAVPAGLLFAASVFITGCGPAGTGEANAPANTVSINASPTANSDASSTEPVTANSMVTLPLLDAVLADEAFVAEAKTALQLTDLEIQQLREASRNAVAGLSEDDEDEGVRSTRAATKEARKQLEKVLGSERANRLVTLIDKQAASGDLAANKPNQVPTDTRVVVNAPAFRMDVFEDGKLIQTYKIGIGYPEFPLPDGLRTAKSIIFNPTWTPPDEPWVKGEVQPGKKVEAGSKLNPLGPIKIPIGLPSLIHGGKAPNRIGTFASHGCVGMTSPQVQDFASRLANLSGEQMTLAEIKGFGKNKTETKEVRLGQPIPVELRYETIVVENGELKIFRDVYERGTNTEANLRRVLEVYGLSIDGLDPQIRSRIMAGLKEMSLDASGNQADGTSNSNSTSNTNSAGGKAGRKANDDAEAGRVTKNIKGRKEVVIKLPQLAGKGYPSPVGKVV